jgi:hypothetical protein
MPIEVAISVKWQRKRCCLGREAPKELHLEARSEIVIDLERLAL